MRLLVPLALALTSAAPAEPFESCESAPVYSPCEIRIEIPAEGAAEGASLFSDITLRAEFRSPKGGRTKVMPAFWDGGRTFRIRFSPDFEGRWDFRLISNVQALDRATGSFQAVAAQTPGFIEVFNARYFKYPLTNTPHYWMGDTVLGLASMGWDDFQAFAQRRKEQGFTHMRASVLGAPGGSAETFAGAEEPRVEHLRELDRRVAYLHDLGLVTDLVLANSGGDLERLFPRRRQRERYIQYVCSRYAAYSVTWQMLLEWESHDSGARVAADLAAAVAKHDPYSHPKSTGATVTSAPLAEDEWPDYITQNRVEPSLASIEYETQRAPFVNTGVGAGADAAGTRRQAWSAATRGHYITLADSGGAVDSPAAEAMSHLAGFFSQSRYFDLQPHYRVVGGSALALQRVPFREERPVGIEYVVYAERPGLIELVMPKQEYSVSWYNPSDGAWFDQKKKFKGDRYRSQTPDGERDWVLYLRREGKKQDYNKSFILESKAPRFREVEHSPSDLPFEIQFPEGNGIRAGQEYEFNATLTRNTIAAKRMLWLWTGEVAGSGRGSRVLGTTQSGRFAVPGRLASRYPATLSVRVTGLDGAGRLFEAFRPYALEPPE